MKSNIVAGVLCACIGLIVAGCGNSSSRSPTGGGSGPGTGGGSGAGTGSVTPRTRYAFNNQCFVIRSASSGQYLVRAGTRYTANGSAANAERFYFKPAALGSYLLYDRQRQLLSSATPVAQRALAQADDSSVLRVLAVNDATPYPDRKSVV